MDLSPSNSEAGAALSDLCLSMGDDCAALALYQRVTKEAPVGEAKWAWLRLGLYQLSNEESTDAVNSFQNVVKSDPEDRFVVVIDSLMSLFVGMGTAVLLCVVVDLVGSA